MVPVWVDTASGKVKVTHMGDLPGTRGLTRKCLLIPSSTASLLPVNTVCRELQLGYDIQPGGTAARFYNSGGEAVQQLKQDGDL